MRSDNADTTADLTFPNEIVADTTRNSTLKSRLCNFVEAIEKSRFFF